MNTRIDTSTLYDSLRALGPISAEEVPDSLARQVANKGVDTHKVKQAIAVYAKLANQGTLEQFNEAVEKGGMAYALSSASTAAETPTKSCCGHTWEGTCTKSA